MEIPGGRSPLDGLTEEYVRTAKGRPACAHALRIISAHRCETAPAPLVCLPSLFRRSGFDYEGRESGVTVAFSTPPIKDLVAIL